MKTIIALLINFPTLLWLTIKPPSKADLLKIIEAEKEANQKLQTEIQNEQSTLLSK
jgi:hypothetical protein